MCVQHITRKTFDIQLRHLLTCWLEKFMSCHNFEPKGGGPSYTKIDAIILSTQLQLNIHCILQGIIQYIVLLKVCTAVCCLPYELLSTQFHDGVKGLPIRLSLLYTDWQNSANPCTRSLKEKICRFFLLH